MMEENEQPDNTCLIVSHNSRMRCLVTTLFNGSGDKQSTDVNAMQNNRFQNGCVLLIKIRWEGRFWSYTVSLIYAGEIDKEELGKKNEKGYTYWTSSNSTGPSSIPFPVFTGELTNDNRDIINIKDFDPPLYTSCDLYIVRHGQGTHNVGGPFAHLKKDTILTEKGIDQAKRTGRALSDVLRNNTAPYEIKFKFNNYFASDLVRSRQTFGYILQGMDENVKNINKVERDEYLSHVEQKRNRPEHQVVLPIYQRHLVMYPVNLVILPCTHEVKFNKNGICDGESNFARENQMNCSLGNIQNQKDECNNFQYSENLPPLYVANHLLKYSSISQINVKWDFYKKFYAGATRDTIFNKNRKHCRNYKYSIIDSVSLFLSSNEYKNELSKQKQKEIDKMEIKLAKEKDNEEKKSIESRESEHAAARDEDANAEFASQLNGGRTRKNKKKYRGGVMRGKKSKKNIKSRKVKTHRGKKYFRK